MAGCEELLNAGVDLLYLAACSLAGEVPKRERLERMDLEQLYTLSVGQGMIAIVSMALQSAWKLWEAELPPLDRKWKLTSDQMLRSQILMDAERAEITEWMEEQKIWYMPLKGTVFQEWYPRYGMRQMGDADILFDPAARSELKRFMKSRGYTLDRGEVHDTYTKAPVYNFEMHVSLFDHSVKREWIQYYEDIRKRLVPDQEGGFRYSFTNEDSYLYFLAHGYKHYEYQGTGLRFLVDSYVFNWKKGKELDWNILRKKLKKLGLSEFEKKSRNLSKKLLSPAEDGKEIALTAEEKAFFLSLTASGTYGSMENFVQNGFDKYRKDGKPLSRLQKIHYVFRRIVPTRQWIAEYHPYYDKRPWLIPGYVIHRFFKRMIFNQRNIREEWKNVKKLK